MEINKDEFARTWCSIHQDMDCTADIAYYWGLYVDMCETYNDGFCDDDVRPQIYSLLLYIEDMGGLGLGKLLADEYRVSADFLPMTIKSMNLNLDQRSDMEIIIHEGIRNAPRSSLMSWVFGVFMTKDFDGLCRLLHWLMTHIGPLKPLVPDKEVIRKFFDREFPSDGHPGRHRRIIDQWLAFRWRDKLGRNLIDLLRECLRDEVPDYSELDDQFEILVCELDKYKVTEEYEEGIIEIVPLDDMEFPSDIKEPKDMPVGFREMLLFGILIDWNDDSFMCEPYMWLHGKAAENFDPQDFVAQIKYVLDRKERQETFTLSTGEEINKHDELESPTSFCNIDGDAFDFDYDEDEGGDEDELSGEDRIDLV